MECSHFANIEGILDSGLQQSCPQSFRQTNEMPCGSMQENEVEVLFPKKQPGSHGASNFLYTGARRPSEQARQHCSLVTQTRTCFVGQTAWFLKENSIDSQRKYGLKDTQKVQQANFNLRTFLGTRCKQKKMKNKTLREF